MQLVAQGSPGTNRTSLCPLWPMIIAETEEQAPSLGRRVANTMVADMRARPEFGIAKYGAPLVVHNNRDHLSDAYQEALDGVVSQRAEIETRGGFMPGSNQGIVALYAKQFNGAFGRRELLLVRDGR